MKSQRLWIFDFFAFWIRFGFWYIVSKIILAVSFKEVKILRKAKSDWFIVTNREAQTALGYVNTESMTTKQKTKRALHGKAGI